MNCQFSQELLDAVVDFHGHNCPGLSIGIRAAEYVLHEFAEVENSDLVCVSETDMCGIDGIQFLTQCTLGKGNLILVDHGKAAFSFYDRKSGKAFRIILRPDAKEGDQGKPQDRDDMIRILMEKPLADLFDLEVLEESPPRRARILTSLTCENCREQTMESRTRRFDGRTLCIPCFAKIEQKI